MNIREVLRYIIENKVSIEEAEKLLSIYAIEYIDNIARLDINREIRKGVPEVIYGENKKLDDLKSISLKVLEKNGLVIISRINKRYINSLKESLKDYNIKIGKYSNTIFAYKEKPKLKYGPVGLITAGTSDIKIAEEAEFVLEAMECKVIKGYDAGIAGVHRLFSILKDILENNADVIITIAGMEGALASLVASLVDIPVIGVPTSIGYGYGSNGYGALASMLQSCSFGLAVVNIDNGIGAGALAAIIAKRVAQFKPL
jgi:hypothetical protein